MERHFDWVTQLRERLHSVLCSIGHNKISFIIHCGETEQARGFGTGILNKRSMVVDDVQRYVDDGAAEIILFFMQQTDLPMCFQMPHTQYLQ